MAEVLSNKEIVQLLTAINAESDTETRRPDKFSGEQIQTVSYCPLDRKIKAGGL